MLLRQQGGGHQHRHLLVVLHREKGGAHRHFGFAEADVAAHQAIHRQRLTHIAYHRMNRLRLIRRSLKREAVAEQLILFAVKFKGVALLSGALRIDIQQFRRHVAHFFRRFLARARPGVAAQLVQRGVFIGAAGVTANQMQRGDRHVELGVVSVSQHQVFRLDAARFQRRQADIAPDAMLQMHHRLTGMQFRQVADQHVGVDSAARFLTTAGNAFAQQVAFAD